MCPNTSDSGFQLLQSHLSLPEFVGRLTYYNPYLSKKFGAFVYTVPNSGSIFFQRQVQTVRGLYERENNTASGRKYRELWKLRVGNTVSIGSSTPNPPIKALEARSPFPDFFYRGLYVYLYDTRGRQKSGPPQLRGAEFVWGLRRIREFE